MAYLSALSLTSAIAEIVGAAFAKATEEPEQPPLHQCHIQTLYIYIFPQTRYTPRSSPCSIVRSVASEQPVQDAITGGKGEHCLSLM